MSTELTLELLLALFQEQVKFLSVQEVTTKQIIEACNALNIDYMELINQLEG